MPADGSWLVGRIVAAEERATNGDTIASWQEALVGRAFDIRLPHYPAGCGTDELPSSHSVSSGYVDSSDMASPLLIMRTELFE